MGDDWGYSGWDASDLFGGGGDVDDDEHDNKAAGDDSEVQVAFVSRLQRGSVAFRMIVRTERPSGHACIPIDV